MLHVWCRYVYKLVRASKRTRNPGSSKQLDVVINSSKGLRELRIDMGSQSKVSSIMLRCLLAP